MANVSVAGAGGSTPGNTVAPLTAGTPSIWPSVKQTPMLAVIVTNQFDSIAYDITHLCVGVNIVYGFDVSISTATVELTTAGITSDFSKYSLVQIYCSAGSVVTTTPNLNGIPLRFTGIYVRTEASLWPHTWSMVCRGLLSLAEQYRLPPFTAPGTNFIVPTSLLDNAPVGILLFTNIAMQNRVVNSLLAGPDTDANAIIAILSLVGAVAVAAGVPGGFSFDPADIHGTTAIFGTINPLEFLWTPYRSALDIIQQFDQVCLGYRTYETYGGRIVRQQIRGYPFGTPDTVFTEGVDIWEGSSGVRSVEQLCNAASVEGATIPGGQAGIINYYLSGESNPFQPASLPVIDQFSHPWIEASDIVVNTGLSAVDVANWRLAERNRELVTGQWVTFRDDLLGPGRVVTINSPHTGLNAENVWMQRIEIRMTAEPVSWTQTISGLGGGLSGYGPNTPWTPPALLY